MVHCFAGGDIEQVAHLHSLKARRLLEAVGNTAARTLRYGQVGNILAVPKNLPRGCGIDAHNSAGKAGLSAAVGSGDNNKFFVLHGQGDVAQNVDSARLPLDMVGEMFDFKHIRFLLFSDAMSTNCLR